MNRTGAWLGMALLTLIGGSFITAGASIIVGNVWPDGGHTTNLLFMAYGVASLAFGAGCVKLAIVLGRRVYGAAKPTGPPDVRCS